MHQAYHRRGAASKLVAFRSAKFAPVPYNLSIHRDSVKPIAISAANSVSKTVIDRKCPLGLGEAPLVDVQAVFFIVLIDLETWHGLNNFASTVIG